MSKTKDKELVVLLDRIFDKLAKGEKLTQHEQLVKAYTINQASCHHPHKR